MADAPPPPPRLTGTPEIDLPAISQWLSDFYTATVRGGSRALDPNAQGDDGAFDPDNLPSPNDTNLGLAQRTANEATATANTALENAATAEATAEDALDDANTALVNAATAQNTATYARDRALLATGSATVTGTATTFTGTFSAALANTNYVVFIQPRAVAGSPATGGFIIKSIAKTTADFTATLLAAPGAGTSVTFDFIVFPLI